MNESGDIIPPPKSRLARWCKIVLLGCALGAVFVAANILIFEQIERATLSAPFKISEDPVKSAVTGVINSQLSAFRRGDFTAAYGYADATLRQQFPPAAFANMVKTSYPAIATSRASNFGVILDNGGIAVVMVSITSPAGHLSHYQYVLRRERKGWRISAVTRVHPEGDVA